MNNLKNLIIILFCILGISNISSAQTGWGYVNYTSYKTHNGNGSTNQYSQFANVASDFDVMFNTANTNTTIFKTGEVTLATMCGGSGNVPKWNSDFYGFKFEFWFVPQETGIYNFGINSDDASDLSIDGTIITTYYGGHGAGGYQVGSKSLVAGTKYKVIARFQEYGGGDAFYLQWSRPSSPNTYSYWSNEVTNISSTPSKIAKINFDFGSTFDKTKFSVGSSVLSSIGSVDVTNQLDTNIVQVGGYKGTIVGGQVEWSYVDFNNGVTTLYVDLRTFGSVGGNTVTHINLLDVYSGPVTFLGNDAYWCRYRIPSTLPKVTNGTSTNSQYIRNGGDYYAFMCDVSFGLNSQYKTQSVTLSTTNNLTTLYNGIVTVSDVYLAFKELSNGGIFGNESGNEFTYGIQYKNADVNDDGVFNESDTYRLLQHLSGTKNIVDVINLKNTIKLFPSETYNNIGKTNWSSTPPNTNDVLSFDINTGKSTDTFDILTSWKGDVNLSHSSIPTLSNVTTNNVKTMSIKSMSVTNEINASIIGELINGKLQIVISLDPLQQEVVGTQFQLNYDNSILKFEKVEFITKGNPMNYGNDRGTFINVGSLISDGSTTLDKSTEYKITFTPIVGTLNTLGLTSISSTDAVNKNGTQLKVKLN